MTGSVTRRNVVIRPAPETQRRLLEACIEALQDRADGPHDIGDADEQVSQQQAGKGAIHVDAREVAEQIVHLQEGDASDDRRNLQGRPEDRRKQALDGNVAPNQAQRGGYADDTSQDGRHECQAEAQRQRFPVSVRNLRVPIERELFRREFDNRVTRPPVKGRTDDDDQGRQKEDVRETAESVERNLGERETEPGLPLGLRPGAVRGRGRQRCRSRHVITSLCLRMRVIR